MFLHLYIIHEVLLAYRSDSVAGGTALREVRECEQQQITRPGPHIPIYITYNIVQEVAMADGLLRYLPNCNVVQHHRQAVMALLGPAMP
jgi:hypothetical protein